LSVFFVYSFHHNRAPPSFPTRRSSDLNPDGGVSLLDDCRSHKGLSTREVGPVKHRRVDETTVVEHTTLRNWCRQFALTGQTSLRSEEHTSELQSRENLVCRLLLEKKNN